MFSYEDNYKIDEEIQHKVHLFFIKQPKLQNLHRLDWPPDIIFNDRVNSNSKPSQHKHDSHLRIVLELQKGKWGDAPEETQVANEDEGGVDVGPEGLGVDQLGIQILLEAT